MIKMTSWDDAFLIFQKWRDDPDPPLIALMSVTLVESQGEMVSMASGGTGLVIEANSATGKVRVGSDSVRSEEFDLSGATFKYSDSRDSPPIDGEWECALEATFPDGRILAFAESGGLTEE
jgi:hypothetical protein